MKFVKIQPHEKANPYNKYMNLDDHVCCCHHVSLRKLLNFVIRKRPRHASMMSECLDAGTGCGWCIPILKQIHSTMLSTDGVSTDWRPGDFQGTADEYAARRTAYLHSGTKNAF